jgi:type VI secretion system FHA domain protein
MALRLRVVSDQRRQLGPRATIAFGAAGGSIGRSTDNDWVLPDPHRYLSGRHARVHFRQGAWYLEDTSTNGVYVNDADQPIPKQAPHELRNGDVLRLGEYHVVVAIDASGEAAAQERTTSTTARMNGSRSVALAGQEDLGASLNLQALLATDSSPSDSFRAVNAYGQAVGASFGRAIPEERESSDDSIARRIARLAKAAQARERERASGAALYDVSSGLQAFCRGAGIEADVLPAESHTRMLHLAGQLFREALLGLKDLGRTQQELRNRFRIESPRDPEDTRPSLERTAVDDVLAQLLASHDTRRLDAVAWLREGFAQLKGHEEAVARAMRAAFLEFVGRLEPAELEARFERAPKRGRAPGSKEHNWELYTELYRSFTEAPPDHLPHLFVEVFANVYRELRSARS